MRFPWECHDQLQESNCRHCVTGPELPFFHERKGILKIDQPVLKNAVTCRLSMRVACSYSSALLEIRLIHKPSRVYFNLLFFLYYYDKAQKASLLFRFN